MYERIVAITGTLPIRDSLLTVVGFALLTHLVFNRYEPFALPVLAFLLLFVPTILSSLFYSQFSIVKSLLVAFVTYHTCLLGSISTYRLSPFHPLAKYPGPILMKLSTIWVYKMTVTGKRHELIQKLHEYYNADVIRTGPNELSVRDVSFIVPILGTYGLPKGPAWDGRTRYSENRPLIGWRDTAMHAKRRRPWNRGLGTAALKEYEPTLAERVTQFVDLVLRTPGKSVDLAECIRFFSYDFMGDMAFGGGTDLMRDGDVEGLMDMLQTGLGASILAETFPWLSFYVPNKLAKLYESAAVRAKQRVTVEPTRRDLFYYLNNDDGAEPVKPPISMVAAEGSLAIIAGADTTALAISNTLHLLLQNPSVYERLQQEIDKFYPPGENALDCSFHPEMHFLDAVINESLRVYPVIPSGSQRATGDQGMVVNNCYIPPHTSIRLPFWTIHRDPRNFSPSPDVFWPERWLIASNLSNYPTDLKTPFNHNLNAFLPFSFGPANCTGKALAYKEIKMILCYLLQQAGLKFADGYDPSQWEVLMKDFFTFELGPLPVVLNARNAKAGAQISELTSSPQGKSRVDRTAGAAPLVFRISNVD